MLIAPPAPVAELVTMLPTWTGKLGRVAGGLVAGIGRMSKSVTAPPTVARPPPGEVLMLPTWMALALPVLMPPVVVTPLAAIVSGRPLVTRVSAGFAMTNDPCPEPPARRVIPVTTGVSGAVRVLVGAGKVNWPTVFTPERLVALTWPVSESMRKSWLACRVSAVPGLLFSIALAAMM